MKHGIHISDFNVKQSSNMSALSALCDISISNIPADKAVAGKEWERGERFKS